MQVPFIFKNLVDTLGRTSEAAVAIGLDGATLEAAAAVPFAMVLGYGIARTTASGAQEVGQSQPARDGLCAQYCFSNLGFNAQFIHTYRNTFLERLILAYCSSLLCVISCFCCCRCYCCPCKNKIKQKM